MKLDVWLNSLISTQVARKANARAAVVAVEANGDMVDVAKSTLAANDGGHDVKLVHAHSKDVHVGVHLTRRADVVVAEILDHAAPSGIIDRLKLALHA